MRKKAELRPEALLHITDSAAAAVFIYMNALLQITRTLAIGIWSDSKIIAAVVQCDATAAIFPS